MHFTSGQTGDMQARTPLAEQRRIVAKVEELLPLIDHLTDATTCGWKPLYSLLGVYTQWTPRVTPDGRRPDGGQCEQDNCALRIAHC